VQRKHGAALAANAILSPAQLTLTFPAGTTSRTLDLAVKEDGVDEDDETVRLALGPLTNATAGAAASYTLTITDDDAAPRVAWNLLEPTRTTSENQPGPYAYQIVLVGLTERVVTVPVTVSGSATAGTDYTLRAGDIPVTFNPGESSRTVQITVIDDPVRENGGPESIGLTLTAPTNATLAFPTVRRHFIRDND
jgi:hypothetical protein